MDLSVRDSAQLLKVSEKTIYRWVKQGKLPAYRINEQYRFNRAELLEWATSQRLNVSADIFAEPDSGGPVVGLTDALKAGGIHYRLSGADKLSVLQSLVEVMPLPEQVDRQFLLQVLLARESLGSTALGNGIAVPHVRNPIVMHIPRPMVTLCFLEQAIEFGALDGQPVHTLFTIVSPTIRAHLHLLARLGFALRQPAFVEVDCASRFARADPRRPARRSIRAFPRPVDRHRPRKSFHHGLVLGCVSDLAWPGASSRWPSAEVQGCVPDRRGQHVAGRRDGLVAVDSACSFPASRNRCGWHGRCRWVRPTWSSIRFRPSLPWRSRW